MQIQRSLAEFSCEAKAATSCDLFMTLDSTTYLQVGSAKTWRTRVAHDDAYLDLGGARCFMSLCGRQISLEARPEAEVQLCNSLQSTATAVWSRRYGNQAFVASSTFTLQQ